MEHSLIYVGIIAGILALIAAFGYSKKVESYQINIPRVTGNLKVLP